MKKKIINGIMMVALVAATSTSFVSCKDTNEDVKIEQAAEIAQLKGRLTTLENKYGDLDGRISALSGRLDTAEDRIDNHAAAIETLQKEVDELETWLVEAFAKLVTSVEISGTYNNLTGSINIPGFEPKMLINCYGVAEEPSTTGWPKSDIVSDKIFWAVGDELGTGKSDKEYQGFSGYLYANINRYIDSVPVNDEANGGYFTFSLVNTAGEKADGVQIKNFDEKGGATTDVLQWGWTRADNNIYKFVVNYDGDAAANFKPAKLDLSLLKNDIKAIWRDRNRSTGTSKEALGRLFADLYYNYLTKDTNLKKYALKVEWSDNTAGEYNDDDDYTYNATDEKIDFAENTEDAAGLKHMATSEAELVFATIKPLGFNNGDILGDAVNKGTSSVNNVIDKLEPYIDRIINRVKKQINIDNFYLDEDAFDNINTDPVTGHYILTITQAQLAAQGIASLGNIDIDIEDIITPMEQSFGKLNSQIDNIKSLMGKINGKNIGDFVEKFTNKFNTLFQNHRNQVLSPVLLAITKDGIVNRVSGIKNAPYVVEGEVTLEPTTYTAEILAPAYAKFVGCKDIDAENFNKILYTGDKKLKFTPEKGKLYEIVYEAVDYVGNTYEHTYYIQGK